jgi:hypothetical protein
MSGLDTIVSILEGPPKTLLKDVFKDGLGGT